MCKCIFISAVSIVRIMRCNTNFLSRFHVHNDNAEKIVLEIMKTNATYCLEIVLCITFLGDFTVELIHIFGIIRNEVQHRARLQINFKINHM